MNKIIILSISLLLTFNIAQAKNIECNKIIEKNKCERFENIFNKVKNSKDISKLKKNYIKNKTDEITYYIKHEKMNPEKQYSKLFKYINRTVKDKELLTELNLIKHDLWDFLNLYAKSEFYKSNFKEEEY